MKLSQIAYQRFKEALLTGQIKSGSVLSQSDLVTTLGVPVSPLREAIQVLEAEGLLTVMPRSGIRIVQPDLELIKNAHQLRRLLEREAVLKFTISCPPDELEAWAERHVQLVKAIENGLDQPDLAARHAEVDRRGDEGHDDAKTHLLDRLRVAQPFQRGPCDQKRGDEN